MEHAARTEEIQSTYKILVGKRKHHFGALSIGSRIILKWISQKYCVKAQNGFN